MSALVGGMSKGIHFLNRHMRYAVRVPTNLGNQYNVHRFKDLGGWLFLKLLTFYLAILCAHSYLPGVYGIQQAQCQTVKTTLT